MKHTMTFDLPDEQHELHVATRGGEYLSLIDHFTTDVREIVKYGEERMQATTWEDVQKKWWDLLQEHSIDPYSEGQ